MYDIEFIILYIKRREFYYDLIIWFFIELLYIEEFLCISYCIKNFIWIILCCLYNIYKIGIIFYIFWEEGFYLGISFVFYIEEI